MSKRLIYAEDALANIDRDRAYMSDVGRIHAKAAVNEAPTVEEKHGRWLPQMLSGQRVWICSECPTLGYPHWKRCPVCEAKMDGDGNG